METHLHLLAWVARLLGAWYVFAGMVALNAWRRNALIGQGLEGLAAGPGDPIEQLRSWTILAVGLLTLGSGLALVLLSRFAVHAFLACCAVQGAYFAWARRALPPKDDAGRRARAASLNAFMLFLAVTGFVIGCRSVALLR